jgi:hypothetical protein
MADRKAQGSEGAEQQTHYPLAKKFALQQVIPKRWRKPGFGQRK